MTRSPLATWHRPSSKRITIKELASYFHIHRNTMRKEIKEFGGIDFHDMSGVLDFVVWYKSSHPLPS